jgi:predicted ferric reductase
VTFTTDLIRCRLRDASATPSKPKSLLWSAYATITALAREVSYATPQPITIWGYTLHLAPLGPILVLLANLVTILVLMFYKFNTLDQWSWENIGYRAGFVTICQLPLIFLLAGKQNIIGFLTGLSYERLNWFHRWIARTLWLSATIHMGFWFRDYGQYDYIVTMITTDPLTMRGFSAWCILTFIVITTFAPIRRWNYEFFVVQHLVTFAGFIAAVWLHAPDEVKVWVWIPIGLVVFDRVARFLVLLFANVSLLHPFTRKKGFWANKASLTPLPGNVTRITIQDPVIRWKPGQHVFLACHSIVPLQSHPFTIASIPSDGKLEFLVRAEKGGTRRFFRFASKNHGLGVVEGPNSGSMRTVFVEGPYGAMRPLRQFDSVVLLAGGMGCTFTMPLLRDIVQGWKEECQNPSSVRSRVPFFSLSRLAVTKRIRFVWVIKTRGQLSWLESQFQSVLEDMKLCQKSSDKFDKEIEISIYLTCDESLSEKLPAQPSGPDPRRYQENLVQSGASQAGSTEKKDNEKDTVSIRSLSSSSSSERPGDGVGGGCRPDGGCCCTVTIKDEDAASLPKCTCSGHAPSPPAASNPVIPEKSIQSPSSLSVSSATDLTKGHEIKMLAGRPHPRTIIRNVLERAEGESAVVVCGPPGLADDVRRSVVSLSDERAVHKGTGAQGIYLHVETFGW